MFSTLLKISSILWATFKLLSTDVFNLIKSKILSYGKNKRDEILYPLLGDSLPLSQLRSALVEWFQEFSDPECPINAEDDSIQALRNPKV